MYRKSVYSINRISWQGQLEVKYIAVYMQSQLEFKTMPNCTVNDCKVNLVSKITIMQDSLERPAGGEKHQYKQC